MPMRSGYTGQRPAKRASPPASRSHSLCPSKSTTRLIFGFTSSCCCSSVIFARVRGCAERGECGWLGERAKRGDRARRGREFSLVTCSRCHPISATASLRQLVLRLRPRCSGGRQHHSAKTHARTTTLWILHQARYELHQSEGKTALV